MQSTSINILVSKTQEYANIPTFGSDFAAGADLFACIDPDTTIEIKPNETTQDLVQLNILEYLSIYAIAIIDII